MNSTERQITEPKPPLRWYQYRLRTLLLLTAILAIVLGLGTWIYRNWEEYHVATLDCGDGRLILITAATAWEVAQPLYYRVVVNGETVVPKVYFTNAPNDGSRYQFDVVKAESGNLVGVVESGESGDPELVILHDFVAGGSWPRLRDDEGSYLPSGQSKWQDYFDRLRRENPTLQRSKYFNR
jgi:hypothetical protein